jgi:hypothetical protein
MSTHSRLATAASVIAFTLSLGHAGAARAQAASSRYPTAAPIEQYRSKSQAEEIALARSAAPASISANAEVLVLGDHGYETAVKGTNGFVCFVERSWAAGFDDPEILESEASGTELLQRDGGTDGAAATAHAHGMGARRSGQARDHRADAVSVC